MTKNREGNWTKAKTNYLTRILDKRVSNAVSDTKRVGSWLKLIKENGQFGDKVQGRVLEFLKACHGTRKPSGFGCFKRTELD